MSRSELHRVCGPDVLRSPRREYVGGEWDAFKALPSRQVRRLIGAGWLRRTGEAPDVLAERIIDQVAGVDTVCEAVTWYISAAGTAMREQRAERWRRQFRNRDRRADRLGFGSYHYHRLYRAELGVEADL